jgi:hypothetical protein
MKQIIFSVRDSKAGAYLPPFFMPTRAQAERAFADCINDEKHQFGKHPEDYTFYEIGSFDDHTGKIETTEICTFSQKGVLYIRTQSQNEIQIEKSTLNHETPIQPNT